MQGKKYGSAVMEQAYALFDTENNINFISRRLGVPESTLRGWKKAYDERTEQDDDLAKLRAKKKERFARKAWRSIELSMTLLERRLERAVEQEAELDRLLQEANGEDAVRSERARKEILGKLSVLRCEDMGKLATVLGTLYDKQALIAKEETEIVGGEVRLLKRFEEL